VLEHYDAMLSHYGRHVGLRVARKHLGWYLKDLPGASELHTTVIREEDPARVLAGLARVYDARVAGEWAA
jgi:tRNA-dihydrouridine synthase B